MNPNDNKEPKTISYYFLQFRDFLHSIAAKTYPFVERGPAGEKLFLDTAYQYRAGICKAQFGQIEDMRCTRIFIWHEFLHLWGAVLFWAIAVMLRAYVLPFPFTLILPAAVIIYFAIQEFYVDRLRYKQRWLRGLIDFVVWGAPLIAFVVITLISK